MDLIAESLFQSVSSRSLFAPELSTGNGEMRMLTCCSPTTNQAINRQISRRTWHSGSRQEAWVMEKQAMAKAVSSQWNKRPLTADDPGPFQRLILIVHHYYRRPALVAVVGLAVVVEERVNPLSPPLPVVT